MNILYAMKISIILISAIYGIASAGKLSHRDAITTHSGSQGTGQSIESHPNSASQTDTRPVRMLNAVIVNAAAIVDGQIKIFPYGKILKTPILDIGESGEIKIETGYLTNEMGQQIQIKGRVNVIRIPTDAQALSSVLAKSGITLNQFIQLTGELLPHQRLFEITPSIISLDGIDRNVKTGIYRILTVEILQLFNPTDEGITLSGSQGTGQSIESRPNSALQSDTRPIYLMKHIFNFALIIDGQVIVFPYGEIIIQAPILGIGESINIKIESGFATAGAGHTVQINSGLLNGVILPTDYQAISISLAKSGITPEQFVILIQFIQLTGAILPQHVFLELSPSILYIDGNYRNVNSGIMRIMSIEYLQLLNPTNEGAQIPVTNPDIEVFTTRTVLFTETAVHVTQTIYEPVTLTKTSTRDEYITLTSPVYNSIDVTITNFIKQTVSIPEEQVIRSPVAGRVVVNTIPVPSQTVLTVTNSVTNYFVQTDIADDVSTIQHFATNYSISTVLVNNTIKSTVVQTITRTSVATAYSTSTIGSTLYKTTTVVITLDPATGNVSPQYY